MHPHIGNLQFSDAFQLKVADLPGLIEGSHANKGLGHKFLKHIERTKIILFVLDGSLSPEDKRSPLNDLSNLISEISLYDNSFLNKPFLIALNKCDTVPENYKENLSKLQNDPNFYNKEILRISAKDGNGLSELAHKIRLKAEELQRNQYEERLQSTKFI